MKAAMAACVGSTTASDGGAWNTASMGDGKLTLAFEPPAFANDRCALSVTLGNSESSGGFAALGSVCATSINTLTERRTTLAFERLPATPIAVFTASDAALRLMSVAVSAV